MTIGAAVIAVAIAFTPSAAMAVGNNSMTLDRTCYPGDVVYTMLNTGGATEYYWNDKDNIKKVYTQAWPSAVKTTVKTGFQRVHSQVFVKAGYVYAEGTGTYCRP